MNFVEKFKTAGDNIKTGVKSCWESGENPEQSLLTVLYLEIFTFEPELLSGFGKDSHRVYVYCMFIHINRGIFREG